MLGLNKREEAVLPNREAAPVWIPLDDSCEQGSSEEREGENKGMKRRVDSSPQFKSPSSRMVGVEGRERKNRPEWRGIGRGERRKGERRKEGK